MFEARLERGEILKKIVDSIKDLVKEVDIDISRTGMYLQAMDSSHVALVSLNLEAGGFNRFRADKPFTLGLDLELLSTIMKFASNDDIITMKVGEDPSTISFIFESHENDKVSEFTLDLLTPDSYQLGIPDIEYGSICALSSSEFSRICREMSQTSETISIETSKQYIKFSITGEIGGGSTTLRANESDKKEEQTILEVDEPVTLSFALRYLNLFNKAQSLSPQVVLYLSGETPLVVEYKIEKLGSLKFYLAPKINDKETN